MNSWRRLSLRVQLWLLVLLAVVPTLAVIGYVFTQSLRLRINELKENGLRFCRLQAAYQERIVDEARELLTVLSGLTCWREGDSEYCRGQLLALEAKHRAYRNLVAIDSTGRIRCSAEPVPEPVNVADQEGFGKVLTTRRFVVSKYSISRITGSPCVIFLYPVIEGSTGDVEAVVTATLDLEIEHQYLSRVSLPQDLFVVALDETGTILTCNSTSPYQPGEQMPSPALLEAIRRNREGVVDLTDPDGIKRTYAFAPVGSEPVAWTVSIGMRRDIALAPIHRRFANIFIGISVATALALIAARVFAGQYILRPVGAVVEATRKLAAGELRTRVGELHASREIVELGAAFDQMAASLEKHTTAFRALATRLQAIREEESARIAREMHDQLGQALSSLKLDLS